jgi:hypothetical protein
MVSQEDLQQHHLELCVDLLERISTSEDEFMQSIMKMVYQLLDRAKNGESHVDGGDDVQVITESMEAVRLQEDHHGLYLRCLILVEQSLALIASVGTITFIF